MPLADRAAEAYRDEVERYLCDMVYAAVNRGDREKDIQACIAEICRDAFLELSCAVRIRGLYSSVPKEELKTIQEADDANG